MLPRNRVRPLEMLRRPELDDFVRYYGGRDGFFGGYTRDSVMAFNQNVVAAGGAAGGPSVDAVVLADNANFMFLASAVNAANAAEEAVIRALKKADADAKAADAASSRNKSPGGGKRLNKIKKIKTRKNKKYKTRKNKKYKTRKNKKRKTRKNKKV